MSRIVQRPIAITQFVEGEPQTFKDCEDAHRIVSVIDRWIEVGRWWEGEGERRMMCVQTDLNGLFELEWDGRSWFIYKVWD